MSNLLFLFFDIDYFLIQVLMVGVFIFVLVVVVSNVGVLGLLGLGVLIVVQVEVMIVVICQLMDCLFNVNLFCYVLFWCDVWWEVDWVIILCFYFVCYGSMLLDLLSEIYQIFVGYVLMLELFFDILLVVVSFYFGFFEGEMILCLWWQGIVILVMVILLQEVLLIEQQGIDVVVVQGYEVGGYWGIFVLQVFDVQLSIFILV